MPFTVRHGRLRKEPVLLAICLLLLLMALLPPLVNLHRFQYRIADAISRSIGRAVSMDSVALQLLPWPGLRIRNLQVEEDPAFGAEPALRAPEVVTELRLSSLWRGRFELSRVDIADASVNLVRNEEGRWNVGSVLLEASHVRNAPTAQTRPGAAPRFPYIEASGIRINVKRGKEKLPYSLLNADFSMSLARPEVWRLKLEGQPVRTDLELFASDTGTLRVEGELHRASAFGTMPLVMEATWSRLPLGQASRMLLGRDGGWRGDVDLQAQLRGEMDALHVETRVVIANLHRQEFTPTQSFNVDATCDGYASRSRPDANTLQCRWPLGRGGLRLARAEGSWTLLAEKVPASVVAAAVGLLRPQALPARQIGGEFDGSYQYQPRTREIRGSATAPEVTLGSEGRLPEGRQFSMKNVRVEAAGGVPAVFHVTADPLALRLPEAPMLLSAELWSEGYSVHAEGGAMLEELRPAFSWFSGPDLGALSFPLLESDEAQDATVRLAVTHSGAWLGPSAIADGAVSEAGGAQTTGPAHFEHVIWRPAAVPVPVAFPAVDATLAPGWLRWTTPSATLGEGPGEMTVSGSAEVPLGCGGPDSCVMQFSLHAASLDWRVLQAELGDRETELSALMDRLHPRATQWPAMKGTLPAGVLMLGRLPVRDAALVLAAGGQQGATAEVRSLDGSLLGGTVHLQGTVAWETPRYALRGSVAGVSARALAGLWDEDWGPGTLGGSIDVSMASRNATDLTGSFHASWLHGDWLRGEPGPAELSRFASWDGEGRIDGRGLQLVQGVFSGTGATLTGTIGFDRRLALQLVQAPGAKPVALGGTLEAPLAPALEAPAKP